ncbi:MAG: DEAD/DEAH box helicase family protein, partial [Usitatibacteraceae bacterium]
MLRNLELKTNYSSETDNLYFDFFLPALTQARIYRRAVGYFSLGVLLNTPAAMSRLVGTDGKIELIFGQLVSHGDFEALREGLGELPLSEELPSFQDLIEQNPGSLLEYRTKLLAWLFGSGRLEIKIAIRPEGLFHQKIGILEDGFDDVVSFTGSMNETMSALDPRYNSEEIAVFKSWQVGQSEYVESHRETFARLWSGNTGSSTIICPLPDAIASGLRMVADRFPDRPDPEDEDKRVRAVLGARFGSISSQPCLPEKIGDNPFLMREHQLTALRRWSENDNNGILELATGAGKTITAIYAAVKTIEANEGITLIVAVPYQDLADQWCNELRLFNIHAVKCYGSRNDWEPQIQAYLSRIRGGRPEFLAIVVVNRTLVSDHFQAYVKQFDQGRLFFIGDECHHHGSQMCVGKLFPDARFRLGLSATPFHYLDDERNVRLAAVYDRSVFQYSLAEAVRDAVLTPYEYLPVVVELTETEAQDYVDLSTQISRVFAASQGTKGDDDNSRL